MKIDVTKHGWFVLSTDRSNEVEIKEKELFFGDNISSYKKQILRGDLFREKKRKKKTNCRKSTRILH